MNSIKKVEQYFYELNCIFFYCLKMNIGQDLNVLLCAVNCRKTD